MSGALAAAADAFDDDDDLDDAGQDDTSAGGPAPIPPERMLPIRPRAKDRGGLNEPKLLDNEAVPEKPLLKQEIVHRIARWLAMKNLCDEMEDDDIQQLAGQAKREYELDDTSRNDWKARYKQWMDLALQIATAKTYPWPNASNVIFPLFTVAALNFNARAYPAIVQGRNVVRGTVIGDDRGVAATSTVVPGAATPGQQPGAGGVGASGPSPVPGPGAPPSGAAMPGMGAAQPNALGQAAAPPPEPGQPLTDPQGNPIWLVKPGAKQKRADNIGRHMSWQLLNEQTEWEEQTDRLLIVIAIAGTMFRKTYFDPSKRRNVSESVDALRVCVNYKAKSFDDAPRITEEIDMYPWEIETMIRSGLWRDTDYGHNHDTSDDEQAPVTFCEQQRRWDLDGDGYDEPLIVTFARDSGELARVVPGFDEECIEATDEGDIMRIEPFRIMTKYGFVPNPDGGVYDIGYGHLLYPLNESINTTINQMFDAGHLANAGGGFIGGGMSLNAGSVRFTVGEYKVINTPGRAARDNIIPLDFKGPNAVLFQLMQFLVEAAKDIASINDILQGEIPGANVPGILGL
ncbi:MAG TPA: hypothetical protein VE221_07970, partial [Sphingomicrobium sp.]|nr:hypothetical protein [Sphingomicrobium sp.]